MRVGFVGYGRFGRALGELASRAGYDVLAFDEQAQFPPGVRGVPGEPELRARSVAELSACEIVILAVPVAATAVAAEALAPHLDHRHLVFDVGSVKLTPEAAMRGAFGGRVPFVATHPLFGPVSLALEEKPRRVVVCPNDLHPEAEPRARAFYEKLGCEVHVSSAHDHDVLMAKTHAAAFFLAKGLMDVGAPTQDPLAPPSFQALVRTIESVRSDAGHLFRTVEVENPFARGARKELLSALHAVDDALASELPSGAAPTHETHAWAIPDLGTRSPALREAREHIDRLDVELIELLARRIEFAKRAAKAKSELGAPVKDLQREGKLLDDRARAAEAHGLVAADVQDVFEAILRLSRRAQGGR